MVTITGNGAIIVTTLEVSHYRGLRIDPLDLHKFIQAKIKAGETEIGGQRVRITIEKLDD